MAAADLASRRKRSSNWALCGPWASMVCMILTATCLDSRWSRAS